MSKIGNHVAGMQESEDFQFGWLSAERLKETLARIGSRVAASEALRAEKQRALNWCRANGNPHNPIIWPSYGLHGEN